MRQGPNGFRPQTTTPTRTRQYEDFVAGIAKVAAHNAKLREPSRGPHRLTLKIFFGDRRRRDGDNVLKAVVDGLVKGGLLVDDAWEYIPEKHVYCALDARPRVEVEVETLESAG